MDHNLHLLLWTSAGTFCFALVGALFGGLAGWLSWRNGSISGSGLGRRLAEALARLLEGELSDSRRAILTGAADGALFLGLVGTVIGLAAGQGDQTPADWLVPAFVALVLLAGGAVVFGGLAYGLVSLRTQALLGVFVGGMGGALLSARCVGVSHIVPGAVAGILLGALTSFLLARPRE